MTTLALLGVPSILACLALEAREGRITPMLAGFDGGIAICLGAIVLKLAGAI